MTQRARPKAVREEFGWRIKKPIPVLYTGRVPVLREGKPLVDPKTGKKVYFEITKDWLEAAVKKQKFRREKDGYEAPLHVNHHGVRQTRDAGFIEHHDVVEAEYEGKKCHAMRSILYDIPDEEFALMASKRLPYLSAEIHSLLRDPEVDSCAVMSDTVPHYRGAPLVPEPEEGDAGKFLQGAGNSLHSVQLSAWIDDLGTMVGPLDITRFCACDDHGEDKKVSLRKSLGKLGESLKGALAACDEASKFMDEDGEQADGSPAEPPPQTDVGVKTASDPAEGADQDESEAPAEPEEGDEGGKEDEDMEGRFQALQAEYNAALAENAELKGELAARRAKDKRAKQPAAPEAAAADDGISLQAAVSAMRAAGLEESDIKAWTERGGVELAAFARGVAHVAAAATPPSTWTGDVVPTAARTTAAPARKNGKKMKGGDAGFIQALPANLQAAAAQLSAEYDQLGFGEAGGMSRSFYVVDSMIALGDLDEKEFGDLRDGSK